MSALILFSEFPLNKLSCSNMAAVDFISK